MMLNKWWKKSPRVLQATCKLNLHISNVIWNLLLLHASQLFKTYNSNLTFLKAKYGGKSQDFNTKDFCKTINYIQDHFQTRNFNYTAVESSGKPWKGKSQKQISRQVLVDLLFIGRNIFCPQPTTHVLCFHFTSAQWAGNFVVSWPEVGIRIIQRKF